MDVSTKKYINWRYAHDTYLEVLLNIFKTQLKGTLKVNKRTWDSEDLLDDFSSFIYDNSSKKISIYL